MLFLRNLSEKSFEGIDTVTTLMLVDSKIDQFPGTIFLHMPNVEVITLERTFIKAVTPADFQVKYKFYYYYVTFFFQQI